MSTRCFLLDVPVEETKGEGDTTYYFKKDEHAKQLRENLAEMQANEGLLTDVVVCTASKDCEEKFHSMLLAACSPVVKRRLVERSAMDSESSIVLQISRESLEVFRGFIYKSEARLEDGILDDLHNFAVKYDIGSLKATCVAATRMARHRSELVFDDHEDVLSELFEMFLEKELTTTVIEDKEGKAQFPVHGPLIGAASPVLQEALLKDSSAPGKTKLKTKLRLNVSSVALGDLIEYIYSAKVTLQRQNAVDLLEAACTFQMPALARVCCDWLIARLHTYDATGILCLGRELDSPYTGDLEEAVKSYIVANFSQLSANEEFNSLWYEDLKEIIQDDKLDVETEEDVFGVVMRWIECDKDSRLPHLCDLLSCVRLEQTSREFLDDVENDPLVGKCPRSLQVLDVARQKLDAAEDKSRSSSKRLQEGDYDQDDDTSSLQFAEDAFLKKYDSLSSVSAPFKRGSLPEDCLPDSDQPKGSRLRRDGRPDMRFKENRELYLEEGANKNGRPDKRLRENRVKAPDLWKKNGTPNMQYDDTPALQFSESAFVKDYDSLSSVSAPFYRGTLPRDCFRDSDQPGETSLRKDGQPDMRFKENRELYLEEGTNKSGSPDRRLRENRPKVTGPLKKNGTPDMRYKVNKEAFDREGRKAELPFTPSNKQRNGPLKKNGTPDMRFKVNREALTSSFTSSPHTPVNETSPIGSSFPYELPFPPGHFVGPIKKDGTPDMRYTVNKRLYGAGSATTSVPRGPLKNNGTPDMRYAVNKQAYGPTSPSPVARGPMKKDGTPDMRFKANRR